MFEFALEQGTAPEQVKCFDGDRLLEYLSSRTSELGSAEALLGECALNRYCMPRSGAGSYATDSPIALTLLAAIGKDLGLDRNLVPNQLSEEAVAFYLFENIVPDSIRRLTPAAATKLAVLFHKRNAELEKMRRHCRQVAAELVASPPTEAQFPSFVQARLDEIRKEVEEIGQLDSRNTQTYLRQLAEDPKTWLSVASLVGATVGFSETVTAAFAITAFSTLGAQAVKAANLRRDALRSSPWSFVYYAGR